MLGIQNTALKFYSKVDTLLDAQIFFSALELDIYTKLEGGKTVEVLSEVLGCNSTALEYFLNVLIGEWLLYKEGRVFYLAEESARFLSKKSSEYIGEVLLFRKKLSALVNIKELIDSNQEKNTEKLSQNKFFDFAEMAQINIQEILTFRKQTLLAAVNSSCQKGPKNVLDLGGGAGAMLGVIAKQYPCASYTLFESPVVAKIAYDYIKQISLKNTVKIIEGDFLKDDIRNDYDLIIASGIFPFAGNALESLAEKIYTATQKDGFLFVYDTSFAEKGRRLVFEKRWLLGNLKAGRPIKKGINLDAVLQKVGFSLIKKTADDLYPLFIYQKCKE